MQITKISANILLEHFYNNFVSSKSIFCLIFGEKYFTDFCGICET